MASYLDRFRRACTAAGAASSDDSDDGLSHRLAIHSLGQRGPDDALSDEERKCYAGREAGAAFAKAWATPRAFDLRLAAAERRRPAGTARHAGSVGMLRPLPARVLLPPAPGIGGLPAPVEQQVKAAKMLQRAYRGLKGLAPSIDQ